MGIVLDAQEHSQDNGPHHDSVLLGRVRDLHPASAANGWVRDIAVAPDLI